jgi:hypothetical protein
MNSGQTEKAVLKEKLVDAYFKVIEEIHARNLTSSAIQKLLFEAPRDKAQDHRTKPKKSPEPDPQVVVEALLTLKSVEQLKLSKGERNLILDWITVKMIQLINKTAETAAFDYLYVYSRRVSSSSRATIDPSSWKQRTYRATRLIKTNKLLDSATHALRYLTKAYRNASYTSDTENPRKKLKAAKLHQKRSNSDAVKKGKRIAQKMLEVELPKKK